MSKFAMLVKWRSESTSILRPRTESAFLRFDISAMLISPELEMSAGLKFRSGVCTKRVNSSTAYEQAAHGGSLLD